MRAGVHARASTRLCAFSTARLFAASRVSAFARGHDARATRPFLHGPRGGGGGGGAPPAFFSHRRPRRGRGRGAWQWRTVRARLDVAVRPDTYREELDAKIELARAHFAGDDGAGRAAIPLPRAEVFESARRHFRMRAEFRVWHEGDRSFLAMFDSADPKTPVEVPLFPMGSERINALMPKLLEEVMASDALRKKLFQVNFLTTVAGDAMISMLYHRRLAEEWIEAAEAARRRLGVSVVGRSRKQKVSRPLDRVFFRPFSRTPSRRFGFRFGAYFTDGSLVPSNPARPRTLSSASSPVTIQHESYHRILPPSHGGDDRIHAPPTEETTRAARF